MMMQQNRCIKDPTVPRNPHANKRFKCTTSQCLNALKSGRLNRPFLL